MLPAEVRKLLDGFSYFIWLLKIELDSIHMVYEVEAW